MKKSKNSISRRYHAEPIISFEEQSLTSFSGLVLVQSFFTSLNIKRRLRKHLGTNGGQYGLWRMVYILCIHFMIGFRRLRSIELYRHDPLILRTAGVSALPDVSTISRCLGDASPKHLESFRKLSRNIVHDDLRFAKVKRITLDFDGSVLSTKRKAEMTAVGFNKKKKGARSYYPLFCTVAQTAQVLDVLFRPGNVHDSKGACGFAKDIIGETQKSQPKSKIETRMDSAFFSCDMIDTLDASNAEFSISVPFQRMAELKIFIESRERWTKIGDDSCYFEKHWKPKCWSKEYRFIFVKSKVEIQNKECLQLDLFVPKEFGFEYKVIITNKGDSAEDVIKFHDGRGSQEGIFAEMKSQNAMEYVPFKRMVSNEFYLNTAILAHNLCKSMQIRTGKQKPEHEQGVNALWKFNGIENFCNTFIRRAGKITHPQGKLSITISGDKKVKELFLNLHGNIKQAA